MNTKEQPQSVTDRTELTSSGEVGTQSLLPGPANQSPDFSFRSLNDLQPSVELHIEELVLHGFDPANRYAIGEAVKRELTRLFTEQGAPTAITQDGEIVQVDIGAFEMSAGFNAETIGIQLAKAIYGGLSR